MSDKKGVYVSGLGRVHLDIEATIAATVAGDPFRTSFVLMEPEVDELLITHALWIMVEMDRNRLARAARMLGAQLTMTHIDQCVWAKTQSQEGDLRIEYRGFDEVEHEEVEVDDDNNDAPLPGQTPIRADQARDWACGFGQRLMRHVWRIRTTE